MTTWSSFYVLLAIIYGVWAQDWPISSLIDDDVQDTIPNQYHVVMSSSVTAIQSGDSGVERQAAVSQLTEHTDWLQSIIRSRTQISSENSVEPIVLAVHNANGSTFVGYTAQLDGSLAQEIQNRSEVASVESVKRVYATKFHSQHNATWNLQRLLNRENVFDRPYVYDSDGGASVDVYVVDSGIFLAHKEFGGRARWGSNFIDLVDSDDYGHGTEIASIIGGVSLGVARAANLISVKVLGNDGSGTTTAVIRAIDWIIRVNNKTTNNAVIVLPFTAPKSTSQNYVIQAAVRAGITVIGAAGNDNADSCLYSPASANGIISVGAVDSAAKRAKFSNNGKCVNIFAPGVNISAANIGDTNSTTTISGTSAAAAHAAGVAAILMSSNKHFLSPSDVRDELTKMATKNAIMGLEKNTPNLLLYLNLQKDKAKTTTKKGSATSKSAVSTTKLASKVLTRTTTPADKIQVSEDDGWGDEPLAVSVTVHPTFSSKTTVPTKSLLSASTQTFNPASSPTTQQTTLLGTSIGASIIGAPTAFGNIPVFTTIPIMATVQGVATGIGQETSIGQDTKIGQQTSIGQQTIIGNPTSIGQDTSIGPETSIGQKTSFGQQTRIVVQSDASEDDEGTTISEIALPPNRCDENKPCSDGSCCSQFGWCGRRAEYCEDGCLANCRTTGLKEIECNSNINCESGCCSVYGYCGTGANWCDKSRGCIASCTINRGNAIGSQDSGMIYYVPTNNSAYLTLSNATVMAAFSVSTASYGQLPPYMYIIIGASAGIALSTLIGVLIYITTRKNSAHGSVSSRSAFDHS